MRFQFRKRQPIDEKSKNAIPHNISFAIFKHNILNESISLRGC